MTIENFDYEMFIKDLESMYHTLSSNGLGAEQILFNIMHDVKGISQEKRCFLPRSDGYYERNK